MTVEKIKEIIDGMIDEKLVALKCLSDIKYSPENHEAIQKLCVEGKILLKLKDKIVDVELEEFCK